MGGTVLAGTVLLGSETFGQKLGDIPADVYADRLSSFTAAVFESTVGSNFAFSVGGNRRFLRLEEVEQSDFKAKAKQTAVTSGFLLIFESVSTDSIPDGIYEVTHPELGTFAMSMSTLGVSGRRYQASFNRILS